MSRDASPALFELRSVTKTFGATRALDGVNLALHAGEVHVLAGGNGAGKSTLIKILSGAISDYQGELYARGLPLRFADPGAARQHGVLTIHQELSLVPTLSITDNVLLAQGGRGWSFVSRRRASQQAAQACLEVGLDVPPETLVEALSISDRQLVEIARALHTGGARLVIFDEPTSALSDVESRRLFDRVGQLRESGCAVVYITHRMHEIRRLADRITVLRDGQVVLTRTRDELDDGELVRAMLGHDPSAQARSGPAHVGRPRLTVRELPLGDGRVSFELHEGEILGLAGLMGSFAAALLRELFGAGAAAGAERVQLDGTPFAPRSPGEALAHGVALLASDRSESVIASLSVLANATLSSLRAYTRLGFVSGARERADVQRHGARIALGAPSLAADAGTLSGGNQQKLALVRCLLTRPRVLLLDDPTRGVDVGARAEVHQRVRELAQQGASVLLFSSDLDELCELCDRVLCLRRGSVVFESRRGDFDRERLLRALLGASA